MEGGERGSTGALLALGNHYFQGFLFLSHFIFFLFFFLSFFLSFFLFFFLDICLSSFRIPPVEKDETKAIPYFLAAAEGGYRWLCVRSVCVVVLKNEKAYIYLYKYI